MTQDSPPAARPAGPRRVTAWWVGCAVLVAASLLDLAYVVHRLSARLVNEDQMSVLAAANELLHLRVRQPSFPGQHYGTYVEGLAAAALVPLAVPPMLALTWTLALLWYGAWLAVAVGAWRAGARASALLAAGAPLLHAVYPVFFASTFASAAGRFVAVVAAVLLWRGGARLTWLGIGLGAVAVVADPSAVVPLAVGAVLGAREIVSALRRRPWWFLAGCLPAAGWGLWRGIFAARHPDYGLHAAPALEPSPAGVVAVAGRAESYGEMFSLALLPGGTAVLVVSAAVLTASLLLGTWWTRAATVTASTLVVAIASTPRALDDVSAFLPGARVFLAVPFALLLLLAALESRRPRRGTVQLAVGVLVLSAVFGALRAPAQRMQLEQAAPAAPVVPVLPVDEFEQRCLDNDVLVRREDVRLLVFLDDRAAAYGCPLFSATTYDTLLPSYERRTWRLYEEQARLRDRLAVIPGDAATCAAATAAGWACRTTAGPGVMAAVVEAPGVAALAVVRGLGVGVRPFGPGCTPPKPETCG